MNRKWLIIPDYENVEESVLLAEEYQAAFEYNDFWNPKVYENPEEVKKRIQLYKSLNRSLEEDTLHGVFLDMSIVSKDMLIREYSGKCYRQSMEIANELGVKGVVFHSGLIGNLTVDYYIREWLLQSEAFFRELAILYPDIEIYLENTFEQTPDVLVTLKKRMSDVDRFKLCLDYGHACLSKTDPTEWVLKMAPYIGHMHVNDNDLMNDLHLGVGEGQIDFIRWKQLLEQNGVNTSVLLELNGIEKQRKSLAYMSGL